MELVLEIVGAQQFVPTTSGRRRFLRAGGSLGRAEDCDWVIPDQQRHLSNRHARVSYRDGRYFLTDTSSNGIRLKDSGAHLPKGEAHPIENGTVFCMGSFDIQARLVATQDIPLEDIGRPTPAGSIIPDDSFLELDPLASLDQEEEADRDDLHGLLQSPAAPPAPAPRPRAHRAGQPAPAGAGAPNRAPCSAHCCRRGAGQLLGAPG